MDAVHASGIFRVPRGRWVSEMTATTTMGQRNQERTQGQAGGALAPLRVAGFKVLAGGYTINELGNWLGDIALAVLVFDQTGSPLATGLLFGGTRLGPALLAPATVARVKARPPRVALPLLYGADAAVFAVLALLATKHFSLPLV